MKALTQTILDEFIIKLRKEKYKNKIQDLKLEYCQDENNNEYLYLALINIKKSQRNMGYGSAILDDITQLANQYNLQIKLWVTEIYGSELKRLIGFYKKHGLILFKTNSVNQMIYKPKKIKK